MASQKAYYHSAGSSWDDVVITPASAAASQANSVKQTFEFIIPRVYSGVPYPRAGTTAQIDLAANTIDIPIVGSSGDLNDKFEVFDTLNGNKISNTFTITLEGTAQAVVSGTGLIHPDSLAAETITAATIGTDVLTIGGGITTDNLLVDMDVVIDGIVGTLGDTLNGNRYRIASVSTNDITLKDRVTGTTVDFAGLTYTSGGTVTGEWQSLTKDDDALTVNKMLDGTTPYYVAVKIKCDPFADDDSELFVSTSDISFNMQASLLSNPYTFTSTQ